jgi:CRP-like cAMP-binding protein
MLALRLGDPVIDLRDQLADFETAARRLLTQPARPRLVLVAARPATCHPDRPNLARGLCRRCYQGAWHRGELTGIRTNRTQAQFVADYELLRSEGYTRRQIAERLGMAYDSVSHAYRRAVRAGALTPDRRTA